MNEHGYIAALRKRLAHRVYWLKTNMPYARGIPDLYLSGSLSDWWVEAKYAKPVPPVLDLTDTRYWLSAHQQRWLKGRHREGRNVAVIVGSPDGSLFLPGEDWVRPIPRDEFKKQAIQINDLADILASRCGLSSETLLNSGSPKPHPRSANGSEHQPVQCRSGDAVH